MGGDFQGCLGGTTRSSTPVGLKLVADPVRVTPGHRFLYKGMHIQGQENKFFGEQGSHPNFLLFATARGLFPLHRKSVSAA